MLLATSTKQLTDGLAPSTFLNHFLEVLSSVDFHLLSSTLSSIGLVLLGVVITIFVLTVTLLGKAAKVSKERRAEAEQKISQDFDRDIENLKKQIETSPHDIATLKQKIEDLETKKTYTKSVLDELDDTYNTLGLKESVLFPGGLFLLGILLNNWVILISENKSYQLVVFLISFSLLFGGIRKIIFTLQSIQYFSLNIKDDQIEQLQNTFIDALKTVESDKSPKPVVTFKEKPPFIFKVNTENNIEFKIGLKTPGKDEAKNVDAWFLFSPEIEIIESSKYGKPFSQTPDYSIPKANTVRYKLDLVKKHTADWRKITINPTVTGMFKMRYKVDCDDYAEAATSDREHGIIIEE